MELVAGARDHAAENLDHLAGVGTGREHRLLGAPKLRCRHHLHGLGDLLRVLDAADPTADVDEGGHQALDCGLEDAPELGEGGLERVGRLPLDVLLLGDRLDERPRGGSRGRRRARARSGRDRQRRSRPDSRWSRRRPGRPGSPWGGACTGPASAPRSSARRAPGSPGWTCRGPSRTARTPRARGTGRDPGARRPATAFMAFVCAEPPTRETELPTLMAGRMPELKRSLSRKICPSVMEMTLVGMYAEMSPGLGLDDRERGQAAAPLLVGELGGPLEEAAVKVEDVAGVGLAARRTAQEQRDLPVRRRMLRKVVVDAEGVLALVAEVLTDGRPRVRGDVQEGGRVGGAGRDHDGVGHGAELVEGPDDLGDGRLFLPDGHVDADDALPLLVDDRVEGHARSCRSGGRR